MAGHRVLLVASPTTLEHDPVPGHPEQPERQLAVLRGAAALGLGDDLAPVAPRPATLDELAAVHDPGYLDALRRLCARGGGWIDGDTAAGPARPMPPFAPCGRRATTPPPAAPWASAC